jgi:glutathione synthase/RimK-type ligase-like ATP-grasp enzyme
VTSATLAVLTEPDRAVDREASLLVAGGSLDPNLDPLEARARARGLPLCSLRIGPGLHPRVRWDLAGDALIVDGQPLRPTAIFLRHDVFAAMQDPRAAVAERALAWHTLVSGWALAHEDVRVPNRRSRQYGANKPLALHLARSVGLRIPATELTNDVAALRQGSAEPRVVKPINGGALCEPLLEVLARTPARDGVAASPAIVQQRLEPPELRVYVVGRRLFAFRVISAELDYRASNQTRVEPEPTLAAAVGHALLALAERLGLDWAAADLKTDRESGELCFLEINSAPMFVAFDRACDGALADALLDWLTARTA